MKGRSSALFTLAAIFLAVSLLLTPKVFAAHSGQVKTIKIGTIMGLTGPLSIPSTAFDRGWDMFADQVRAQGGIKIGNNRYVFKFIHEDSRGTAAGAGTAARLLVNEYHVKYIIGAMLESEIAAIYQVTRPAGVLYGMANINIPHSPVDVGPNKPLLVRLSVTPDDDQPIDLDYVKKEYPSVKTIAVSAPKIGYEGMIARLKKQAAKRGMKVTYVGKWAWGTTDFLPVFTRIISAKPDLIFCMYSGQAGAQLVAARQMGFKGPFISNSPLGADVIIHVARDPNMLTNVIVNSPDVYHPDPRTKELMAQWHKKWPRDPFISDCIHAMDMPSILAQAMVRGQTIDPAKVLDTLQTMTAKCSLKLNFGCGHMGGMKRFGVNRVLYRPFPITRIMHGKTQFIGFFAPHEE